MIGLATLPAPGGRRAPSRNSSDTVLYESLLTIRSPFIVGGHRNARPSSGSGRSRPSSASTIWPDRPRVWVGGWQALALIPGVSRSGGHDRRRADLARRSPRRREFTFSLAMPTMAAAFLHDLLDLRHGMGSASALEIAVGFLTAFLAALVVVRPFLNYVRRSGFGPFAWYRILVGVALLAALGAGWI
jgi:undecaprenyl-diphosphatase